MNKLELTWQESEPRLKIKFCLVMCSSSSLAHLRKKKKKSFNFWNSASSAHLQPHLALIDYNEVKTKKWTIRKYTKAKLEHMIMVAWSICCNRNEVRQSKPSREGGAILHKARFLLNEFQTANFSITLPVA